MFSELESEGFAGRWLTMVSSLHLRRPPVGASHGKNERIARSATPQILTVRSRLVARRRFEVLLPTDELR
jgi:hypothetical protein